MTEKRLYYVYQADGYNQHYPRLVCATSEAAAIDHHKEMWRAMFDKPADAEPFDGTYAQEIESVDPVDMEPGTGVVLD